MLMAYSIEDFGPKLEDGTKKHTFRRDSQGRWASGKKIDHWLGSPRWIRNSGGVPGHVGPFMPRKLFVDTCSDVLLATVVFDGAFVDPITCIDGVFVPAPVVAHNDGFNSVQEFTDFFMPKATVKNHTTKVAKTWTGKCIFFTDRTDGFMYNWEEYEMELFPCTMNAEQEGVFLNVARFRDSFYNEISYKSSASYTPFRY